MPPEELSPECAAATREHMFKMWREMLLEIGFMEEAKADHMMLGLRRIFGRNPLTDDDVRIMMGIARQVLWKARDTHPPSSTLNPPPAHPFHALQTRGE